MSKNVYPACAGCGSLDVRLDAWAEWNTATQAWELHSSFIEEPHCPDCDNECDLEWKQCR